MYKETYFNDEKKKMYQTRIYLSNGKMAQSDSKTINITYISPWVSIYWTLRLIPKTLFSQSSTILTRPTNLYPGSSMVSTETIVYVVARKEVNF